MHDWVGVIDERHENMDRRLEQRPSSQTPDVRVDSTECQRASSAPMRITVADYLVNQRLDLAGKEVCPCDARETTDSFAARLTENGITVDNYVLQKC